MAQENSCPEWLCSRTKGNSPLSCLYLGLQLVKPGSRPKRLQSAALGSAPYRAARVCAAKVPRSLGRTNGVLEPGLEVALAGLDDGTGLEAIGGEAGELGFVKVVKHRVAVLAGGTQVDVRTPGIAELDKPKLLEHC